MNTVPDTPTRFWRRPGALAFFAAMFLNAFVDLGHKIVIQNTLYKLYDGSAQILWTAIINALILLPFLVLISPAGFLSDRFYKTAVMRVMGIAAVVITLGITAAYYAGWFEVAFALTFLLAAQSALYSPAKYGFIKPFFGKEGLSRANGIAQATSIMAILFGSFAFSIGFEVLYPKGAQEPGDVMRAIAPLGWLLVLFSLIETALLYKLPDLGTPDTQARLPLKHLLTGKQWQEDLRCLLHNRAILLSVVGLAMFWSIGQVVLAAFPAFLKETTAEMNTLKVQGVLACTGIGIALGSIMAGRASRHHIELGLLPLGALAILGSLSLLTTFSSLSAFALCFLVMGIGGGLFIVPLNALIQYSADENQLGKTLAANNWVQNLCMLGFLVLTALVAKADISSRWLLLSMILVALAGSLYTLYRLPQAFVRLILGRVMLQRYSLRVQGMRHVPAQGGVLLLGNHISWIDWAIVQLACPRPVRFVMLASIYQKWYLRRFLRLMGAIPIAQGASAQSSLERVAAALDAGEVVCLFPEGTISRTGHFAELRRGFERAASLCQQPLAIVPFYLHGLWGSQFSRASQHYKASQRRPWVRDLACAFGPPLPADCSRDRLHDALYRLSVNAWREQPQQASIGAALINAAKRKGRDAALVESQQDERGRFKPLNPISGHQLLTHALIRARRLPRGQAIAILSPRSADAVILMVAAWIAGCRVCLLDPRAPTRELTQRLQALDIRHVYAADSERLGAEGLTCEPLVMKAGTLESLLTAIYARLTPAWKIRWLSLAPPSAIALQLPTRDEAEQLKTVQYSPGALIAQSAQIAQLLNTESDDSLLAHLPLHQAYGSVVQILTPLLQGITCVIEPQDGVVSLARTLARLDVTLLLTHPEQLYQMTDSPHCHALLLSSLRRLVVSQIGLDRARIQAFQLMFHQPVLPGFGLTETGPVLSCNLPDAMDPQRWHIQRGQKAGSVGMPLPGTHIVATDAVGQPLPAGQVGALAVTGPQCMQGYAEGDHWQRTADGDGWITPLRGWVDDDGFVFLASPANA